MRTLFILLSLLLFPWLLRAQCHHSHAHHYHGHGGHTSYAWLFSGLGGHSSYAGDGYVAPSITHEVKGIHELTASTGLVSARQLGDTTAITWASPNYFVSYQYYIGRRMAIGLSAGMQALQGDNSHNEGGHPLVPYSFTARNATVAATLDWVYCSRGIFQWYGGIGLGMVHVVERDVYAGQPVKTSVDEKFNMHVIAAGFRFGGALGGFAEIGAG